MQLLAQWGWRKLCFPQSVAEQKNNVITVVGLKVCKENFEYGLGDPSKFVRNPTVFITGDGASLPQDIKEFESWGIPHDLYAVNRSLLFHERQIDHWAAIDIEESCWFAQNVTSKVQNGRRIIRHTIGPCDVAFDVWWEMDYPWENDYQKRVFIGNSGYFAVLTAIHMGYKKIVVGGMPLDRKNHWYEPDATVGPNWNGLVYTQWIDFKMQHPSADNVRSLGGYSAFILGKADREWAIG